MNKWQSLSQLEQKQIIENISFKTGLSPNAIEKDWWVTNDYSKYRSHLSMENHCHLLNLL